MISYATNTRTKRNLEALKAAGWRIFLSPDNPEPPTGFRFAIDNGAWGCFTKKLPFNDEAFIRLVDRHGSAADFVVLPDIVAGGTKSLELSKYYLSRIPHVHRLLLPVQDGMNADDVGVLLREHPRVGIFLGGSTEWKLKTMYGWGMVAHAFCRWYHVGRVNSVRRIRLCQEAGATSFDGTSPSMFSVNVPKLTRARHQPSMLTPEALSR